MRTSRVLLAGVAVAAAAAATSAFTNSNTFNNLDNSVAGYGSVDATGVNVSNIAYNTAAGDATKLHSVVFTTDTDTASLSPKMTLSFAGGVVAAGASNCTSATAAGPVYTVTCTLISDLAITAFDKTGFTVTSN